MERLQPAHRHARNEHVSGQIQVHTTTGGAPHELRGVSAACTHKRRPWLHRHWQSQRARARMEWRCGRTFFGVLPRAWGNGSGSAGVPHQSSAEFGTFCSLFGISLPRQREGSRHGRLLMKTSCVSLTLLTRKALVSSHWPTTATRTLQRCAFGHTTAAASRWARHLGWGSRESATPLAWRPMRSVTPQHNTTSSVTPSQQATLHEAHCWRNKQGPTHAPCTS